MKITFLGHAGFRVESHGDVILCDPWFSRHGAYAASWFPFPDNAALASESIQNVTHLYISHWHQDHFDEAYLDALPEALKASVIVLLANFTATRFKEWFPAHGFLNVRELDDSEELLTDSGTRILIQKDENPLYADSAITISDGVDVFVNANDCKLSIERERAIVRKFGVATAFAAQFSGATFHPTCYDYSSDKLREISGERRKAKFQRVLESCRRLGARFYIPSAGPACFLSGDLRHLNLDDRTVFSTVTDFVRWFDDRRRDLRTEIATLLPGDTLDQSSNRSTRSDERWSQFESQQYIERYAAARQDDIARALAKYDAPGGDLVAQAKAHFASLHDAYPELGARAAVLLRVMIAGGAGGEFYFDTTTGSASDNPIATVLQHYAIEIDSLWMQALIDRHLTWEDFILSFRFRIAREPDVYNEAFVAFLQLETPEERMDYVHYLKLREGASTVRIQRETENGTIEYDRYCPHNGEDLADAEIVDGKLICPRHFWQFSLEDGKGIRNPCSIHVRRIR